MTGFVSIGDLVKYRIEKVQAEAEAMRSYIQTAGKDSRAACPWPARCLAVASFYDMFFLQPVGEHVVEVCTNLSCALIGADRLLREFERELDVKAPGTSEDGKITLRCVECLGGCGWGPVVSVDEEYEEHFKIEDVAPLLERLRSTSRPSESHA